MVYQQRQLSRSICKGNFISVIGFHIPLTCKDQWSSLIVCPPLISPLFHYVRLPRCLQTSQGRLPGTTHLSVLLASSLVPDYTLSLWSSSLLLVWRSALLGCPCSFHCTILSKLQTQTFFFSHNYTRGQVTKVNKSLLQQREFYIGC